MKIKLEVEVEDIIEMYGESIEKEILHFAKQEVMKIVKRDAKYKAWINKKASDLLENIEV